MPTHKDALLRLCDLIIKGADPRRGKPNGSSFNDQHAGDNPVHIPPFLSATRTIKLLAATHDEGQCLPLLEKLAEDILEEARQRNPHVPAYFEDCLLCCGQFKLQAFRQWFAPDPNFSSWNQLDERKIQLVAKHLGC